MQLPRVSVVIITYNSKDDLQECIPAILNQDYPDFEVIVVDNASNDGTVGFVRDNYPDLCVIQNKANYGAAKGYNMGINASKGKYVALINPDTKVGKSWLFELVRPMEEDDNLAACQSRVLLYYKPDTINTEGNDVNYLGFTWCRNYGKPNIENTKIEETLGLSTCSIIFRKEVFDEVGLFDEDFFMYLDDTDIGLRIYMKGYKVVCNPKSLVWHKYVFKPNKKKMYFLERNRLVMLLKIYDNVGLLRIIPALAFVELGIITLSIFQGWFKEKIQSYAWIIRNWKLVKYKRQNAPRSRQNMRGILNMMKPEVAFEEVQSPILNKFVNPILRAYYRLMVYP